MEKINNIFLFLFMFLFLNFNVYPNTTNSIVSNKEDEKILTRYKLGIGKDVFSYNGKNGLFLRFFPSKVYYVKLGGYYSHNYENSIKDILNISLINGVYIISKNKINIFSEIDITLNYDFDIINRTRVSDYYDIGINIGFEYFISKNISIDYKFGYYYRYKYNYYRDYSTNMYEYNCYQPVFNNNFLEGLIIYFYFN